MQVLKYLFLFVVLVVGYLIYSSLRGGYAFDSTTIEEVKSSIRSEYQQKGFVVQEIELLRQSPRELVGFVKLKNVGLNVALQPSCKVTMSDDDGRSLWSCR